MNAINVRTKSLRRRRDERPPSYHVIVGLITIAVVSLICFVAARSFTAGAPGNAYPVYYAAVPDAAGLRINDDIRVGGVKVGQVKDVIGRGREALVQFKLMYGLKKLPSGTQVRVRPVGLLGTRYIDLRLGKGKDDLPEKSTIRGGRNALTYGLPEVLDTLNADTRASLSRGLQALGAGMDRRGEGLNTALEETPSGLENLERLSTAVLARRGAAARLMPSLNSAAGAFDEAGASFADAFAPTASMMQPFVGERAQMQATLSKAPETLAAAQSGLQRGLTLLDGARRLAVGAKAALPSAPGGLRATTALLRDSRAPLRRTTTLLGQLRPAIPATLSITDSLRPTLQPLRKFFGELRAPVELLGKYGCDVENMLANWRNTSGLGVDGGDSGGIGPLTSYRLAVIADSGTITANTIGSRPQGHTDTETYPAPCKHNAPLPGGFR